MAKCKDCFHWNACKKMLEAMWGHCIPADYDGGADRCKDFINTAKVIVLNEIVKGHPDPVGAPGDSCLTVLAREIFAEIEAILEHWYSATTDTYDGTILTYIAELKKKYTEGGRNEETD